MQQIKNGSNALFKALFFVIAVSFFTIPMLSTAGQKTKNSSYSPYVGQDLPKNVYFGDTHLHTSISLDAYGDGNTKVGPDEAYRWAKGEIVASDDGMPTRIAGPSIF